MSEVLRLPPHKYIHVVDSNTHVSTTLVGPLTFTRKVGARKYFPSSSLL